MVIILSVLFFGLATLAEWLHARRSYRLARLAFGDPATGMRAVATAATARVVGLSMVTVALVLLWNSSNVVTNSIGALASEGELDRMIVILDASQSMNIKDAGLDGQSTRADRARELIHQLVSQVKRMPRTTLMTFGESALPVVYDAKNWDVLASVLTNSYYSTSFKSEKTAVDGAVQKSFDIAADWIPDSTVVVLVTDGESPAEFDEFEVPPSIRSFVILGVGSREGRPAGKKLSSVSRLDEKNLRRIAQLGGGDFFDVTRELLPVPYVDRLLRKPEPAIPPQDRRWLPLSLFGIGTGLLAMVPFALAAIEHRLLVSGSR